MLIVDLICYIGLHIRRYVMEYRIDYDIVYMLIISFKLHIDYEECQWLIILV